MAVSHTVIFALLAFTLCGLTAGRPGLLSQFRRWLDTQRACASDCPLYLDYVCGFDSQLGYIVAENMCLFAKHNQCQRTDYEIIEGEVCERLLNVTLQPPLVFISHDSAFIGQLGY